MSLIFLPPRLLDTENSSKATGNEHEQQTIRSLIVRPIHCPLIGSHKGEEDKPMRFAQQRHPIVTLNQLFVLPKFSPSETRLTALWLFPGCPRFRRVVCLDRTRKGPMHCSDGSGHTAEQDSHVSTSLKLYLTWTKPGARRHGVLLREVTSKGHCGDTKVTLLREVWMTARVTGAENSDDDLMGSWSPSAKGRKQI